MSTNYNNERNTVHDEINVNREQALPADNIVYDQGMEARRIRQNIIETYFT